MGKHHPVFCSACRIVVLCPWDRGRLIHPPEPWVIVGEDLFCSAGCQEKGPAQPVRERANYAHIRVPKDLNPNQNRGFFDALLGYDCIGALPSYVKGHGEGMKTRAIIEEAQRELSKHGIEVEK